MTTSNGCSDLPSLVKQLRITHLAVLLNGRLVIVSYADRYKVGRRLQEEAFRGILTVACYTEDFPGKDGTLLSSIDYELRIPCSQMVDEGGRWNIAS